MFTFVKTENTWKNRGGKTSSRRTRLSGGDNWWNFIKWSRRELEVSVNSINQPSPQTHIEYTYLWGTTKLYFKVSPASQFLCDSEAAEPKVSYPTQLKSQFVLFSPVCITYLPPIANTTFSATVLGEQSLLFDSFSTLSIICSWRVEIISC